MSGERSAAVEPGAEDGAAPRSKGHLNPGAAGVEFDRFELGPGLGELVRHVWVVRWDVPAGQTRPQRVLGYPAFNAVIGPEGAMLSGPDPRLFVQTLTGSSWVVGVLFRPAAGVLLTATAPAELVSRQEVLAEAPVGGVQAAMGEPAPGGRQELVGVLRRWLGPVAEKVDERGRELNEVCLLAETDASILRVAELAERVGLSVRSLERLVGERVGVSPKWLIECRRLQEAATALFAHPESVALSELAASLGYADYSHFSRRYATVLGETPDAARRAGLAARGAS